MFLNRRTDDESAWLSLSDMMTVLMVLFLVIAIVIATTATERLNKITTVLSQVVQQEKVLCEKLQDKLYDNFSKRDLEIECNPIRVIFVNSNYKFASNSSELSPQFKYALAKFFPIYLETVKNWQVADLVDEIRIEGHTDSDGGYLFNMELSQDRSRSVLDFVINLDQVQRPRENYLWTRKLLTANGLSFSRRLNSQGDEIVDERKESEDKEQSRRVEIKLRTKAREILFHLNGESNGS